MDAILNYLKKEDPASVEIALEAYKCFEPHKGDEGLSYARSLQFVPDTCEEEAISLLKQIRERSRHYDTDPENIFNVEQNALITVNAENYYRSMLHGGEHSWNVRDTHMNETLDRLMKLQFTSIKPRRLSRFTWIKTAIKCRKHTPSVFKQFKTFYIFNPRQIRLIQVKNCLKLNSKICTKPQQSARNCTFDAFMFNWILIH
jgi:hypothetical protein